MPLTAIAVVAAIFVVYLPAFTHAIEVWSLDATLSFGFFGPPGAVAALVWQRRQLKESIGAGSWIGLPILGAGLVMYVVGRESGVHALVGLSLLPSALGVATYLAGRHFAAVLAPSLVLLTATLSLYFGLLNTLGFWLQQITAIGATGAAGVLGTHVVRTGVDLFVGRAHYVVAEACSGMNSLLALLYLGLWVAAIVTRSWFARLLLLASIVPIVLFTNIARVTLVLITSAGTGSNLESGLPHDLLSAGMFVCAGLLFLLTAFGLGRVSWLRAS